MKKYYISLFITIFLPSLSYGNDKLPYDTQRKIFIYETIRDYNLVKDDYEEIENSISKSILEQSEKNELNKILEKQRKLHHEIMTDTIFPLLHRSIPSEYIMKELDLLEKSGKIQSGFKKFITTATDAGFSLEGAFEYIREMIIQHRQTHSIEFNKGIKNE